MNSCCNSKLLHGKLYRLNAKYQKSHGVKRILLLALFDDIKSVDSQRTVASEFYTNHTKTFQTHVSK